ncbi:DotG/IcmE/VirB10 family protein [Marinobacter halodurans]|nr:DotG/IcmE/VirB10 family protein [Marinobacter halodurans]
MASSSNQTNDSGAESGSEKKQSAIKFLMSRQGRPTLLIVAIAILMACFILWWFSGVLFGPSESAQEKSTNAVATRGGGTVEARHDDSVKGDMTSPDLTDEAKEAAKLYNQEAASNDNVHPAPTFDDVEIIKVPQKDDKKESEPSGLKSESSAEDAYTYTPPNSGSSKEKEKPQKLAEYRMTREEIRDRKRQRLEAVSQIKKVYQSPPEIASVSFVEPGQETTGRVRRQAGQQRNASSQSYQQVPGNTPQNDVGEGQCPSEPLVRGGEIVYAVNDIALNTDHKGPVRITFLQGNLNGWIGMGSFKLNELGAKMNVTVERLISPAGESYDSKGYVLDPETTLWAVSSDVDYHIIYRYGGFGLASILGGFKDLAEARETQSQTSTVNGSTTEYREPDAKQVTWQLLGDFGEVWQKVFADNIDRPITVTVDPKERFGVLFKDTVCGPRVKNTGIKALRNAGKSDPVRG